MVIIDTDVLLLAFAFKQDPRYALNAQFLENIQRTAPAITVYTLLELLGQLSFNLSATQLDAWQYWLIEAYQLSVIWPVDPETQLATTFREEIFERPLAKMRTQRMAFMDSLILDLAERSPDAECFVTWNARHFKGKTVLKVLTPEEYLSQMS